MAKADYYEVLGVNKDATDSEIKSAFRKAAKQYHPDLHPGDKEAEAKFKEINEANETLSDAQKRLAMLRLILRPVAQVVATAGQVLAIFQIFSVRCSADSADSEGRPTATGPYRATI